MRIDEEEVLIRDDSGLLHGGETVQPRSHDWCKKLTKTLCLSLGFFVLGLCIAIPGPTLLDLGARIGATTSQMMMVFVSRSVGYLVGGILGGLLFDCFDKQLLLFCTLLTSSVATVAIPWSLTLVVMGTMFALQGVTMGVLDTGGNIFCVRMWGKKSGPYMQTLHFAYGIGAFIAPLLAKPFLSSDVILSNATSIIQGNIPVSTSIHENLLHDRFGKSDQWYSHQFYRHQRELSLTKELHFNGQMYRAKRQADVEKADALKTGIPENDTLIENKANSVIPTMNPSTTIKITTAGVDNKSVSNKTDTEGEGTKPADNSNTVNSSTDETGKDEIKLNANETDSEPESSTDTVTNIVTPKPIPTKPSAATDKRLKPAFADGSHVKDNLGKTENLPNEATSESDNSDGNVDGDGNSAQNASAKEENTVEGNKSVADSNMTVTKSSSGIDINSTAKPTDVAETSSNTTALIPTKEPENKTYDDSKPKPNSDTTLTTTSSTTLKPTPSMLTTTTSKPTTSTPKPATSTPKPATFTPKPTTSTPKPTTTTPKTTTTSTPTTSTHKPSTPTPKKETKATPKSVVTSTTKETSLNFAPQTPAKPSATDDHSKIDETGKDNDDKTSTGKPANVTKPNKSASSTVVSSTISVSTTLENRTKPPTTLDKFLNKVSSVVGNISKIQFAYLIIGLALFVNAIMFLVLYCKDKGSMSRMSETEAYSYMKNEGKCYKFIIICLLGMFFFVYVGMEVTYGALVTTFTVKFNHWPKAQGAIVAAIFWGSLATGRGFSVFIARCCRPTFMLVIDLIFMIIGGLVLSFGIYFYNKLLWLGTLILGLGMSSVFPAGILWAENYFQLSGKSTAVFVVGSSLGQMIIPALIGYFFEHKDSMVLMQGTLALSIFIMIVFVIMQCFAWRMGNSPVSHDRNGFLPLEEDDDEENVEMDLVGYSRTNSKFRKDTRGRGNAEYRTLVSDLDED